MELRQLEYAVAVADHGGFTRAAAAHHVSQPALSQGVQTLERELGVALFDRLGRRVAITAAGAAFLGPARQVLRDVDTLGAAVSAVRGVRTGHLDLVALPTLAVDPVATLIGAFHCEHPDVTVRLAEPEDAASVVAMLRDGRCEIGLAATPLPAELVVRHAFSQEILAVCPPGTALDPSRRLAIDRLGSMPLVTTPRGTSTRRLIDEALAQASVVPRVAVETGQREAIVPLVLAGAGTTFLPPTLAEAAAQRGAVVARLVPELRRHIALVTRPGPLSPAAQAFVTLALATLSSAAPG